MIILVDMDGVIADFEGHMEARWNTLHPNGPVYPRHRDRWDAWECLPEINRQTFIDIMCERDFFRALQPIKGSLEALRAMDTEGLKVRICSSPVDSSDVCMWEKIAWVRHHLGTEWVSRVILTKDKTLIVGDVLIDDKPDITGLEKPSWDHVIYDHCYNRHVRHKPRITWENWRDVVY